MRTTAAFAASPPLLVVGLALVAQRARRATSMCTPAANFKPVNDRRDAVRRRRRRRSAHRVVTNNFKRSVFLKPIDPAELPRTDRQSRRRPNLDALSAINAQFVLTGRAQRGGDGRLKTDFRLWDVATGQAGRRAAICHRRRQFAPRRASHLRRDVHPHHRRKGLFRHARRLRRRDGTDGPSPQAPRDHGSGRRQRALSDARRRSRRDAALLALLAGRHLYGLRRRRPQGVRCSTSRAASARPSAIFPA